MELSSSSWLSDLALMEADTSLIHQGELSTLDQLTSQHIAAALDDDDDDDDDFPNSVSAESHTSYPIFAACNGAAVLAGSVTAAGGERPAKLPKAGCSWPNSAERFLQAAPTARDSSSPRILSFGRPDAAEEVDPRRLLLRSFVGASAKPEEAGFSISSTVADQAAAGRRAANSGSRPPSHAHDHLIAERKRRERLSEMFIALSAVVPGLKKMDKASVLGDAIKYVKQLEQRVKAFEERAAKRTVESVVLVKRSQLLPPAEDDTSSSGENSDAAAAGSPSGGVDRLPDVEAKVSERSVLLRIHCERRKGVLVRVMEEVEKLRLAVVNASVIPFAGSALDITVMAQIPQPEIRRDFRGRNQLPAASVAVIDRFLDNQRMDGVSILAPTEDGKGAYVGPEELRALLFGQELDASIIDMFYFFLERRQAEAPAEYFDCHCITAYGKGYIMGWTKDKPKQIEYMNRIIKDIRRPVEKRQLIFSAMHFVNHWVLLVINLVEKSYEVYDSLKQHPKVDLQDYVCLLKDGLYDQLGFDTREWPLITETKFPQQGAGDDCALFVCKAMECMSHKLTVGFPFGQEDMDLFRAKLALEFIEEMNRRNAAIAPVPPPDIPSS